MSISFDAPLSATGRLRQIASRLLARPSLTLASLFLLLVATVTLWPQFVTAANPL